MLLTGSMIGGKMIALLATFSMPLFLTRFLTRDEYGIFAQYYVIVFFCIEFFSLTIHANLYYFYPGSDDRRKKALVTNTFLFLVMAMLIAVTIISVPEISRYLIGEGELYEYRYYILAGVILLMPAMMIEPLYVLRKDLVTSLAYPPAEILLRLTLVVVLFLILPGLNSVFNAIILSAAASLLFVSFYVFRGFRGGGRGQKLFDTGLAKEQLKYGLPFGAAVSLNIFFQRFDKIICISFLSTTDYAVYAIAFYGIPGINQIYDSISQVSLVHMIEKYKSGKMKEVVEVYRSFVARTYAFALPAIAVVMLYAGKIISFLFTENYADAVPLFRVYLLSFLIFMLGTDVILRATGNTRTSLRSHIIGGLIVVPSIYFLTKFFGIWGAMSGALIGVAVPRLLNLAAQIRLVKSSVSGFFPFEKFAAIALITLASITPFFLIERYFTYGVFTTALLGITYLILVAALEIRFDLFPVGRSVIRGWLAQHTKRLFIFFKLI